MACLARMSTPAAFRSTATSAIITACRTIWFIEPSAGFLWSEVWVDPFNTAGTFVLQPPVSPSLPGTVSINNIYSALGRVSLRVGTSIITDNWILQPFATISGFREFQGNNSGSVFVNATNTGPISTINPSPLVTFTCVGFNGTTVPCTLAGRLSATNIGDYGQFGLGVVALIPNTGWLGYVRADYRTGDHIDGWSMNGGLRYQLNLAHPVITGRSAEVLGTPIVPAAYNWTGFYLGPQLGIDWGYTNWAAETTPHRFFAHSSMRMRASPPSTSHSPTGLAAEALRAGGAGCGGARRATVVCSGAGSVGATDVWGRLRPWPKVRRSIRSRQGPRLPGPQLEQASRQKQRLARRFSPSLAPNQPASIWLLVSSRPFGGRLFGCFLLAVAMPIVFGPGYRRADGLITVFFELKPGNPPIDRDFEQGASLGGGARQAESDGKAERFHVNSSRSYGLSW
jgi:Autotransporter beta-domain